MLYFIQELKKLEEKIESNQLVQKDAVTLYLDFANILIKAADNKTTRQISNVKLFGNKLTIKQINYIALYCAEISIRSLSMEDLIANKTIDKFYGEHLFPNFPQLKEEFYNSIKKALFFRIKYLHNNCDIALTNKMLENFVQSLLALSGNFSKLSYKGSNNKADCTEKSYIVAYEEVKEKTIYSHPTGFKLFYNKLISG